MILFHDILHWLKERLVAGCTCSYTSQVHLHGRTQQEYFHGLSASSTAMGTEWKGPLSPHQIPALGSELSVSGAGTKSHTSFYICDWEHTTYIKVLNIDKPEGR